MHFLAQKYSKTNMKQQQSKLYPNKYDEHEQNDIILNRLDLQDVLFVAKFATRIKTIVWSEFLSYKLLLLVM